MGLCQHSPDYGRNRRADTGLRGRLARAAGAGRSPAWPVEGPEHEGTSILYADEFPGGRGMFIPIPIEETSPV